MSTVSIVIYSHANLTADRDNEYFGILDKDLIKGNIHHYIIFNNTLSKNKLVKSAVYTGRKIILQTITTVELFFLLSTI